jgi:putative nucleotidyltransferase with HDIG domain
MLTLKSRARRAEIRKNRPEAPLLDWEKWKEEGILSSLWIAAAFFVGATAILMWRQEVIPYRPGQWIPHDIVARVQFQYVDQDKRANLQLVARDREPLIYHPVQEDFFGELQKQLDALPDMAYNGGEELPVDVKGIFDDSSIRTLASYAKGADRQSYAASVERYVTAIRNYRIAVDGKDLPLILLKPDEWKDDTRARKTLRVGSAEIEAARTFPVQDRRYLAPLFDKLADRNFLLALQPKIVDFTIARLPPNAVLDQTATEEAQNAAAAAITPEDARVKVAVNQPFVEKRKGVFDQQDWQKMYYENQQYMNSLKGSRWKSRLGTAMLAFIVTLVLAAYVASYQPKVVKNPMRALAIAGLMLAMLLLAQLTGLGSGPLYLLGVAPTLLVAMILTIAYEHRFAIGIASMHGMLATVALQQGVMFFIVIWVGVLTAAFLLGDIRTRSKIIEVGGAMAIAMMIASLASGFMGFDPARFVIENSLYAGAAGLAVGFIVLGILPFIEKAFKITTSMTLLELADASHPLLRRLQIEAAGTYNHSLQVATLAEAAAEAIRANSLLCRVGSYYHDIGKIHKAEYFAENQGGGENRHLNLTPSVSLLIIIGHVKDGVEMAKDYNLPTSLIPFIQQHHGTTLVEYFYHQACKREQQQPGGPAVSEMQYRYPGPKPRSKEVAIVMICDAAESACRAMPEPTASRVEALVHDLVMRRLLDGQFDECDLTMRDLEAIERSVMKSLLAIYHGRIQYPSTAAITGTPTVPATATAVRSA